MEAIRMTKSKKEKEKDNVLMDKVLELRNQLQVKIDLINAGTLDDDGNPYYLNEQEKYQISVLMEYGIKNKEQVKAIQQLEDELVKEEVSNAKSVFVKAREDALDFIRNNSEMEVREEVRKMRERMEKYKSPGAPVVGTDEWREKVKG